MRYSSDSPRGTTGRAGLVAVALFCSGLGGIINQVVWQRGLKVLLGGSEALSTMLVVLVFFLGLGAGAWSCARRARALTNPARTLARIETALWVVNLLVAWVLSLDLSETVYAAERMAIASGLPLRIVYALGATSLLLGPCALMGMTLPVASEVCQRQLGCVCTTWISRLLFVNTLGAVSGAIAAGFYLLPYHGQFVSLVTAACANGAAAVALWGLPIHGRPSARAAEWESFRADTAAARPIATIEDWLGFALGGLSLGYEMYLFRLTSLLWWPLPYTFAATLCLFLLLWSLGALCVSWRSNDFVRQSLLGCLSIAAMPVLYHYHRWQLAPGGAHLALGLVYFLPCFVFGSVYGQLVSRRARSWGADVGRFGAFNTCGACLGILLFTLVGYEIDQDINAWVIAAGLLLVLIAAQASALTSAGRAVRFYALAGAAVVGGMAALTVHGWQSPFTTQRNGVRSYYGRDGVVEIRPDGTMIWDGLEHSRLCFATEYLGDNNWCMASVPVMCYSGPALREALVIGLGCGTTAHALTGVDGLHVDVYDINGTLRDVLRDYPQGTYHIADNPRIAIQWCDGRTGLALNPKQYDLITQQPLYLKQAGSGLLLSQEYLQLVRQRLKPGGLFCAYTYDQEHPAQSLVVRQTVQSVFPYCESFSNGWMIVASDAPIDLRPQVWARRRERPAALYAEIRLRDRQAAQGGQRPLFAAWDAPRLEWAATPHVVSDDHPLVEYPAVAQRLVQQACAEPAAVQQATRR